MTTRKAWLRRLDELKRRARTRVQGRIPLFDVFELPDDVQRAC
jgi:hypothetical protein